MSCARPSPSAGRVARRRGPWPWRTRHRAPTGPVEADAWRAAPADALDNRSGTSMIVKRYRRHPPDVARVALRLPVGSRNDGSTALSHH